MFEGYTFLVIESALKAPDPGSADLVDVLKSDGARVYVKGHEDPVNYFANDTRLPLPTHIIADLVKFSEYELSQLAMVPVTTADWVYDSLKFGRLLNPKSYNPDPRFFLKDLFVCIADDLPDADREILYSCVRAFGGQYLDALTKYTTHLIAFNLSNDKSVIAALAVGGSIDIKIVKPEWLEKCLCERRIVDEKPYLVSAANTESSTISPFGSTSSGELPCRPEMDQQTNMHGHTFYISEDYQISPRLYDTIATMITNRGGIVTKEFSIDTVSAYLGTYRSGKEFKQSVRDHSISPVSIGTFNLQWLFSLITGGPWAKPGHANLLHFPIPSEPLPGFSNLKICITNFTGDARFYLSKLISVMGGEFTKTLTKENDILIAAREGGKKYDAAKSKWNLKIVNHVWLEECYKHWKLMDDTLSRYRVLGNDDVQQSIGSVPFGQADMMKWAEEKESGVDDSMSEDESIKPISKQESVQAAELETPKKAPKPKEQHVQKISHEKDINQPSTKHTSKSVIEAPAAEVSRGRSAKQKAAAKLHSDITDLNEFQQVGKSANKLKHYLDSHLVAEDTADTSPSKRQKQSSNGENSTANQTAVLAVATGCEQDLNLSNAELATLQQLNIVILNDYSVDEPINTLIAPRIMRTEKFLKCLSQVDRIVHPSYILDVLKSDAPSAVSISDYYLDKVLGAKELNTELGLHLKSHSGLSAILSSANKGRVFTGVNLNLSANLNGGPEVISKILRAHGCSEIKVIKSVTASSIKTFVTNEANGATIYIAHKAKDSKAIANFKKLRPDGFVLDWDWCVKCIFHMEKEAYKDYQL